MPKTVSDNTTISALAEMFGLISADELDDLNLSYFDEVDTAAYRQAKAEGKRESGAEKAREKAREAARTELYRKWYNAVEYVATQLFEKHGLEIGPRKQSKNKWPYELKIFPTTSWAVAANKIRQTVNGVGDYHFASLKEFLASGPYTERQAVLEHLGYIRRYPEVHGTSSARSMYENHM